MFKQHDGSLPVMSEGQFDELVASYEKRIRYYFPKYLWVLSKRVFQKSQRQLKSTNCLKNCDKQGLIDAPENAEVDAFLYALSKLEFDKVKNYFYNF